MNRNQEYLELKQTLETLEAPDGSVERALARRRAARRSHYVIRPLIGLAAVFAVFVSLVNLSPTVAQACSGIPVLQDLAAAVRFSPSLSEAVENDYYQRVDQSRTVDGTTVTVDSLIVDQTSVNIFYRIESKDEDAQADLFPEVALPDGSEGDFSILSHKAGTSTEAATDYCCVDFNGNVPDRLLLRFYSDSAEEPENQRTEAPFEFLLEFDPEFTTQGKHYSQDQTLELDGQRIHVTGIDLYPSYLSVSVEGAPENTVWLTDLDYYLLTEDGTRFEQRSGIYAVGNPDTPEWRSFRTDSPFFRDPASVTLCITGASWTRKENVPDTLLDLEQGTSENLPPDTRLVRCQRQDGGWCVTLLVPEEQPQYFLPDSCRDPEGGAHSWSRETLDWHDHEDPNHAPAPEGYAYWSFELEDYPWSEVRLTPAYHSISSFDPPVTASFELNP